MQTFRTEIKPKAAPFNIDYQCFTLGIGSCFIENIGTMLNVRQLPFLQNPFGIIYNPLSIASQLAAIGTLESVEKSDFFTEKDLFPYNGLWASLQHHSKFSGEDRNMVLKNINDSLHTARDFFKKTNRIILTLGTAHVFIWKETGEVVANCHKLPPQYFEKKRLNVEEIIAAYKPVFEQIFSQNYDCQIIITISPIRHIRDGLVENNRSKAVLLLAADALSQLFEQVHYFPAYEIMMDDLRDYRFYESDMIHPNSTAIEYIWQHFSDAFFDNKTKSIIHEVEKINQMLAHRPLHGTDTEEYQKFREQLNLKILALQKQYPFLDF